MGSPKARPAARADPLTGFAAGLALLGSLTMNSQFFSWSKQPTSIPRLFGDLSSSNRWVRILSLGLGVCQPILEIDQYPWILKPAEEIVAER